MQTVYIGNTLINDVMLGSQRMDDVLQNTNLLIEYLIVAGGGASGAAPGTSNPPGSGGGGAGGLRSGSLIIPKSNISYTVQVGPGGPGRFDNQGGNGSPSIFNAISTVGGGGGGKNQTAGGVKDGAAGGSGGGGGGTTGVGGAGTTNEGFAGSNTNGSTICGGGGGASGPGGSGAFQGGSGSGSIWLDNLEYSIGGGGDGSSFARQNQGAGFGNGAAGVFQQNAGAAGQNGVIKVRYYGAPIASGGTISQSGGYTYHTYTYSAGVTSSFTY
jgi:hypothetical protein